MNVRLALYQLAAEHKLDTRAMQRLERLAGLQDPPDELGDLVATRPGRAGRRARRPGPVMWIAANWDTLGRFGRFALLQGFVLVLCVGAMARPAARTPLALLALLGIGALFAFFGQTYQTGADPWQLFALWAALALPLCLGARSDVLWAPWALVVADRHRAVAACPCRPPLAVSSPMTSAFT